MTVRFRAWAGTALAAILAIPLAPTPAHADDRTNPVLTWDLHAEYALYDIAGQPPFIASRGYAMVHGAVYDAVNAIAGTPYQPLNGAPRTTGRESVDAAVATAAYRVLDSLLPAQHDRLLAVYRDELDGVPDGRAKTSGVAVGERTSAAMIGARAGDGSFGPQTWTVGDRPGQWRPTPPGYASEAAWVGHVRPFLLPRADMFRTAGPPALTSRQYTRDFEEVKALGSATSTVRTQDQTEAAIWWHDRRLSEWSIKRQLAAGQRLSTLATARLFALVDVTVADAGFACFNEKAAWSFWRPITAVRLADTDGNPHTTADPAWTSLLVTPPFPDYTSGHACATGAFTSAMRSFFGRDDLAFSAYSEDSGTTRSFPSFSAALAELNLARVWGGVHFRSADLQGARIGERTAAYITAHAFRPSSS